MTDDTRVVLKLVAGMLDYPGSEKFFKRLSEWIEVAEETDSELALAMRRLGDQDRIALEKLYVETFDFDSKAALYVTAHELGDSRDRGEALVELTNLYHEAGYEVPDDQLADYLPLLLELLVMRPELVPQTIVERVAMVTDNVAHHLDGAHPYRPLFVIANRALGGSSNPRPTVEERPDLADLPYPIDYQ